MINRAGSLVAARSDTVLRDGDEVMVVAEAEEGVDLGRLFQPGPNGDRPGRASS
jgi:Trk K+ transport system NAD-binding subunit